MKSDCSSIRYAFSKAINILAKNNEKRIIALSYG